MRIKFLNTLLERELTGTKRLEPAKVYENIRKIGLSVGESLSDADRKRILTEVEDFNNTMPVVGEVCSPTTVAEKSLMIPTDLNLNGLDTLFKDPAVSKQVVNTIAASMGYAMGKNLFGIQKADTVDNMSEHIEDVFDETTSEVDTSQEPTSINGVDIVKLPDGNTVLSCPDVSVETNATINGVKSMVDPLFDRKSELGSILGGVLDRAFAAGIAAMKK